jgi:hypothetical protein
MPGTVPSEKRKSSRYGHREPPRGGTLSWAVEDAGTLKTCRRRLIG